MYAVIIAGGRGTRFWPASRKDNTKQLLNIVGKETMLQITVDRLKKLKCVEDVFIVTGQHLAAKISKTIKGVSKENIIIEPSGKNTAPAIGLAAVHIRTIKKDAVMGVFPADHLIIGAQVGETSILSRAALLIANHYRNIIIAQEGAFGAYLLEKDISENPIVFGKDGILESSLINTSGYGWGLNIKTL